MEVDETMITGHLDHARFSGERCGRILNHLSCSHRGFRTGESTRSLAADVVGRVAKRHFAGACGMRSSKRSPPTIARPALPRAGDDRVFLLAARASQPQGLKLKPVSRRFWPKRPITPAAPGSNPEKLTLILFLV